MEYDNARKVLLEGVEEKKKLLMSEIEGGHRNWEAQTKALEEYQEMLRASDFLAGYTDRKGKVLGVDKIYGDQG